MTEVAVDWRYMCVIFLVCKPIGGIVSPFVVKPRGVSTLQLHFTFHSLFVAR